MSQSPTKFCYACAASIDARAEVCPKCGVRQPGMGPSSDPEIREASGNKIAAGLCGIILGGFGVHKFILGMTTPGLIMLFGTFLTCFIAYPVMHLIGIIEGIIYLTKSDADFYETYVVGRKEWF